MLSVRSLARPALHSSVRLGATPLRSLLSTDSQSTQGKQDAPQSGMEKLKVLFAKYGKIAIGTHIGLSLTSLGCWYLAVKSGVDTSSLLSAIGFEPSSASQTASTFTIAYVAHKATTPLRIPVTIAAVPIVAKVIGKEQS